MSDAPIADSRVKTCQQCGSQFNRKRDLSHADWDSQKFCGHRCYTDSLKKTTDVMTLVLQKSIPEPNSGCWLWELATYESGYGALAVGARQGHAHRFAYEAVFGPVPSGLVLDHLCRTRCCCNPHHLEAVTQSINLLRSPLMDRKSHLTHCKRGHAFTPENTRIRSDGSRACRACARENTQKYRRDHV
jgi:hypothetical protein